MWQTAYSATIHGTTIIIILCRIVEMVNVGNGVAESNGAVMRIRKSCGKNVLVQTPFECFLFSSCLISFYFSILLLPSRETDRVKNKTPDTYFTPGLFTDGAKRTRRTTTSRFWVIVIWSSTLKCVYAFAFGIPLSGIARCIHLVMQYVRIEKITIQENIWYNVYRIRFNFY